MSLFKRYSCQTLIKYAALFTVFMVCSSLSARDSEINQICSYNNNFDCTPSFSSYNRPVTQFRFYKELSGSWYADLPKYPGPKEDLLMVAGADTMLDVIARGGNEVVLKASEEPFEKANKLELMRKSGGGGDYLLRELNGETINHDLWLCSVIQYVFGKVPQTIYFAI